MRITRENVAELIVTADDVTENLELVKEAGQEWLDLQDAEPKDQEIRESIREAREALEEALQGLDASSLCQMVHGKHKG